MLQNLSIEAFPGLLPPATRALAEELRELVREAELRVVERLYPGWRPIGHRVPVGASTRSFAHVLPRQETVRPRFEHGVELQDPNGLLRGDGRQVRYVELRPDQPLDRPPLRRLIAEATQLAASRRPGAAALSNRLASTRGDDGEDQ